MVIFRDLLGRWINTVHQLSTGNTIPNGPGKKNVISIPKTSKSRHLQEEQGKQGIPYGTSTRPSTGTEVTGLA